jgi:hypothetical protein
LLLNCGARMSIVACASERKQGDVVGVLLDYGANMNYQDNDGHTALMWCCQLMNDFHMWVTCCPKHDQPGKKPHIQQAGWLLLD